VLVGEVDNTLRAAHEPRAVRDRRARDRGAGPRLAAVAAGAHAHVAQPRVRGVERARCVDRDVAVAALERRRARVGLAALRAGRALDLDLLPRRAAVLAREE